MIQLIPDEVKMRVEESLFEGMPTWVVFSDTGVSPDKESILASARVTGLEAQCWTLELTVANEFGLPVSIDVVSPPDFILLKAVQAASDFIGTYMESPAAAVRIIDNIKDRGCACGECGNG